MLFLFIFFQAPEIQDDLLTSNLQDHENPAFLSFIELNREFLESENPYGVSPDGPFIEINKVQSSPIGPLHVLQLGLNYANFYVLIIQDETRKLLRTDHFSGEYTYIFEDLGKGFFGFQHGIKIGINLNREIFICYKATTEDIDQEAWIVEAGMGGLPEYYGAKSTIQVFDETIQVSYIFGIYFPGYDEPFCQAAAREEVFSNQNKNSRNENANLLLLIDSLGYDFFERGYFEMRFGSCWYDTLSDIREQIPPMDWRQKYINTFLDKYPQYHYGY